jgi:hypothetical protein
VTDRGLDEDGTIVREGALDRVPAAFVPVVDAARAGITATFGGPRRHGARLHSAYLYGSIPRGTAVPGVSDLDLLIVFRDEPADADRAAAVARTPSADPAVLTMLIDDLGPWLAAEYTAVHGEKAPRP